MPSGWEKSSTWILLQIYQVTFVTQRAAVAHACNGQEAKARALRWGNGDGARDTTVVIVKLSVARADHGTSGGLNPSQAGVHTAPPHQWCWDC